MRKGDDGEEKKRGKKKKKIKTFLVATNVVASRPPNRDRLQRRPLVPKLSFLKSANEVKQNQASCHIKMRLYSLYKL